MDYISLFELGLTALAFLVTAINWFISQKLTSFDERLNRLESSHKEIHRIHTDLELHKQKLDLIITMFQNTKNFKDFK